MIHFKLSLLSTTINDNRLTNVKYSILPISEFYDQEYLYIHNRASAAKKCFSTQKHSFNYTYDEKLSLHQNSQKELTFNMSNKIHNQDTWEDNPFVNYIHNGSLLLLEDNFNRQGVFIVKDIKYTFGENSIIYNITCQDEFTYQLSTQNDGYTINNDSSSEDFIGAHTIDWWIYKKIKPECHIAYTYLLMPQGLYKTAKNELKTFSGEVPSDCAQLIKKPYPDDIKDSNGKLITKNYGEYFETIVFSCSGASADSALISLVEQLDLQLITYEDYNNGILSKYFWVEPKKNEERPCLTYSPFSNIQNFSLSHNGSSLSTVLNVNSNTYADELVSLLPEMPNFFYDYFQSTDWDHSDYHIGLFNDLLKGTTTIVSNYHVGNLTLEKPIYDNDNKLIRIPLSAAPQLNKLYNYISFVDKENSLNNSIRFQYQEGSETKDITISTVNTSFELRYKISNAEEIVLEEDKVLNYDKILSATAVDVCIPWYIKDTNITLNIVSYDFPIKFYKEITIEEQTFADIADKCPWLENKLINFDYFLDHNLFTKSEYIILMDKLNNSLRIANGQLLSYTKSYYEAIRQKANVIADLNNSFDSLGAAWNSDINTVINEKGQLPDLKNQNNQSNPTQYFDTAYKTVFGEKPKVPTFLLNRDSLITEYFNKYFLAEQRFLKNIRTFKNYFESPVDTHLKGLYTTEFNIRNTTDSKIRYTFADVAFDGFKRLQPSNNPTVDKEKEKEQLLATKVDIFYKNQGNMLKCNYVKEDNYFKFLVPSIKADSYTLIDEDRKDTKYSTKKIYYKRIITVANADFKLGNNKNNLNVKNTYTAEASDSIGTKLKFILQAKIENEIIKWELIPNEAQNNYLRFFNELKDPLKLTIDDQEYLISNYKIEYKQVSIIDIMNDWCLRYYDKAKDIIKNWYIPKADYKYYINSSNLSYENFVKLNDKDDFDFDTTVKPTFYIQSPIFNFVQTAQGLKAERVNEYGYNEEQYNKETKKGTHPRSYTAETTVNYVSSLNAEDYFTTYNVWKDLLIYGGGISQLIATGLVLNGWANASILEDSEIDSLKHKVDHYISAFGWFKGYKDVNSLIYATKDDAASTWRRYSKALAPNTLYKQNFYDLFGLTKTALLNLRKQGENFYVKPNIWYQVLKPEYIIRPGDSIVWLPFASKTDQTGGFFTGPFPTARELNNIYCNHLFQYKEDVNFKINEPMTLEAALKAQGFTITEISSSKYPYIKMKFGEDTDFVMGYFFRVNKQYYQPFSETFVVGSSNIYNQTAYDYITNQVIDYTTLPELLYGFVMYSSTADQFEPATRFDMKDIYYQKVGENYERAYTLYQLLYDKPYPIYIYETESLTQTEFTPDNTKYQVKLIKTTWIDKDKGLYTSETIDDIYNITATIKSEHDGVVVKDWRDSANDIYITITTTKTEDFQNLNKGNFWIRYHNQIKSPELFSKAAAIESELETYWNVAVNASRLCNYFIPDNWRPSSSEQVNGFTKFLYKIVDNIYMLSDLVPTVEILKDDLGNTSLTRYNISYSSQTELPSIDPIENKFLENNFHSLKEVNNKVIDNLITSLGSSSQYWIAEEVGKANYYYISKGGYTYQMMMSHIANYNGGAEFTGNYLLILRRLMDLSYYQNYSDLLYERALDRHNTIWDEIYRNFGNVIYERTYSNENAADSNELYELASLAFKDYMMPERNYSITIINNHELNYNGEELRIGDPIKINADEYYNIYDSLYQSLSQYLFITDISYSLRSPTDFSLTVNNIKYTDKLLKRLVKLI